MTLEEVLSVCCSACLITTHCNTDFRFFINNIAIQMSNEELFKKYSGLCLVATNEVLSMNTYYNGVETVLTVII